MPNSRILTAVFGGLAVAALATAVAAAEPHVQPMEHFASSTVENWLNNPTLIQAVKAQNAEHSSLSQSQIDQMDKQWRAETGASSRPMIDQILANELSKFQAGAQSTGTAAGRVAEATGDLSKQTDGLSEKVDSFLKKISAA